MSAPSSISLFSTPLLLRASKRTTHREHVLNLAHCLAETLDELELTNVGLSERFARDSENFHIADSDLNQDGLAFAKTAFRSWIAKTDRWEQGTRTPQRLKESLTSEHKKFRHARGAA